MKPDLTLDEIIHLAHCAGKMTTLADRSRIIAEALGIDPTGRAKLSRITQKLTNQIEKHLKNSQLTTHNSSLP